MDKKNSEFTAKMSDEILNNESSQQITLTESNLKLEESKIMDKDEPKTIINKVRVQVYVSLKAISVVTHDCILEPLMKTGDDYFEGFAFHKLDSPVVIKVFLEEETVEIELLENRFTNELVDVTVENYSFESDLFENFVNQTTFIGHRGSGPSKIDEDYVENTVIAFEGAFNKGAKWVELDVQLTKDGVPIIFHNIFVTINQIKVPIINFTYNEISEIYEKTHNKSKIYRNRLLKLKEVMDYFSNEVGFNIEIKYPLLKDLEDLKEYKYIDPLNYVKTILKDIDFTNKKVFFSAFNPQILFALKMLNLKKQLYFLLDRTDAVIDIHHCSSIYNAIAFAKALNISGIVVLDEHLDGDSKSLIEFIHSLGLKILAYGDQLNEKDVVKRLMSFGIDGIITDQLEKFIEHFDN